MTPRKTPTLRELFPETTPYNSMSEQSIRSALIEETARFARL